MKENKVRKLIDDFQEVIEQFKVDCTPEIIRLAEVIIDAFSCGNKLLIAGNGGSAADAQHLAAEFISSFGQGINRRSLPAISLSTDTSILTAYSNDFEFEGVFARQVEGLGLSGDILMVISTSGLSANCIRALKTAKLKGMGCISLTSRDSEIYNLSDYSVGVSSKDTQFIQQCHVIAYHAIAHLVDDFFGENLNE